MSTVIGIDFGGGERAACVIFKIDGKNVLVQDSFELPTNQVDILERSGAPKDIVISDGVIGELPTSREEVDDEWIREVATEAAKP